jgi:hypothetical protein
MTKGLRQISAGDNVVGAYMSSPTGNFFKGKLVDAQGLYQSVGGRKGVVVVYGEFSSRDLGERGLRPEVSTN